MKLACLALILAPLVRAHGQVNRVVAGGVTVQGPNIYWTPDAKNAQTAVRTMFRASGHAYTLPRDYGNSSAMACEGAGPAPKTLAVRAGDAVKIFWEGATPELKGIGGLNVYNPWVHAMGPIMDYLAPCRGDCSSFNPANAGWTKIAESGLDTTQTISPSLRARMAAKPEQYFPTSGPGLWAQAKLLQSGSAWSVSIPRALAPGQYILRSELAAIHNPLGPAASSGPQHYVACVQLAVSGAGKQALPAGTRADALYDPKGAFAKYNVYADKGKSFKVPGPPVWVPDAAVKPPVPVKAKPAATSSKSSSPTPTSSKASLTAAPSKPSPSTSTSSTPSASAFAAPIPTSTSKSSRMRRARRRHTLSH